MYCRRNEVERLFRWLKGFRRVFSRFEKDDSMFRAFIHFAQIVSVLRQCGHSLIGKKNPEKQIYESRNSIVDRYGMDEFSEDCSLFPPDSH